MISWKQLYIKPVSNIANKHQQIKGATTMATKISNSQLVPNKTVIVSGEITFSHVTKKIEGEELRKRDASSRYPHTRPYTTLTLANCKILPEDASGNLSINEQYIMGKMFVSKTHPERNWNLNIENKGNSLPTIFQRSVKDGVTVADQIIPKGELASGLKVTIGIRIFKGNPNCGASLDTIMVDEPIRYFGGSSSIEAFTDRGVIMNTNVAADDAARSGSYYVVGSTPAQPEVPVQEAIPAPVGNPFQSQPVAAPSQPAPVIQQVSVNPYQTTPQAAPANPYQAQPVAQAVPSGNPFASVPAAAPFQAQPVIQQPPVANTQTAPVAASPVMEVQNMPVAASPIANSMPAPVVTEQPAAGIVYDAGNRNY